MSGKMNRDDRKRLRLNQVDIVKTIRVHDVQDLLYQEMVLSDEDMEYVSLERHITPQEAVRRLLNILPERKNDAFSVFVKALKEDYDWLAEQIMQTDLSRFEEPDELDGDEKLKKVQRQLVMQTDLLIQHQQELQVLRGKVEEGGRSQEDLTQKYAELDQVMKETGVTESQVIVYMKEYLRGKGPHTDATDSRDPLQPPLGVHGNAEPSVTEAIARCLGRDIVKFILKGKAAGPPPNIYAATLRRTVTEITTRYGDLFESYLDTLNINEKNGYDALVSVANEIFKSGEKNWGRVVVHYAFGAWIAKHISGGNAEMPVVNFIGDFLGYYVDQNAAVWIESKGGWDNFNAHFDKEFPEKIADGENRHSWGGFILTSIALASLVTIVTLNR